MERGTLTMMKVDCTNLADDERLEDRAAEGVVAKILWIADTQQANDGRLESSGKPRI